MKHCLFNDIYTLELIIFLQLTETLASRNHFRKYSFYSGKKKKSAKTQNEIDVKSSPATSEGNTFP